MLLVVQFNSIFWWTFIQDLSIRCFTHLGTRVLSLLSLEFPCTLVLAFCYTYIAASQIFFVGKNLFSNIVSTKFHYNWSRYILTSLLFTNSVRSIQICRWNLNVHFGWYRFNYPMNQETVSARIMIMLIHFFFEIFNFLIHYWYIFVQVLY